MAPKDIQDRDGLTGTDVEQQIVEIFEKQGLLDGRLRPVSSPTAGVPAGTTTATATPSAPSTTLTAVATATNATSSTLNIYVSGINSNHGCTYGGLDRILTAMAVVGLISCAIIGVVSMVSRRTVESADGKRERYQQTRVVHPVQATAPAPGVVQGRDPRKLGTRSQSPAMPNQQRVAEPDANERFKRHGEIHESDEASTDNDAVGEQEDDARSMQSGDSFILVGDGRKGRDYAYRAV